MPGQVGGQRAYGRHRGVSHTAVRKAIADGRIVAALIKVGRGVSVIDFDAADRLWDANTDGAQQRVKPGGKVSATHPDAPTAEPASSSQATSTPETAAAPAEEASSSKAPRDLFGQTLPPVAAKEESELDSFAAVRKERERWSGELQRLKYEATAGELISGKRANDIVFKRARSLRDKGLGRCVSLAPQLKALGTVHEIEMKLTEAWMALFEGSADEIDL